MIKIELTKDQLKQLRPLFDAATAACAAGKPGAIGAQIWPDGMCAMFFDAKKGRALATALGGDFSNTSSTARAMISAVPPNNQGNRRA